MRCISRGTGAATSYRNANGYRVHTKTTYINSTTSKQQYHIYIWYLSIRLSNMGLLNPSRREFEGIPYRFLKLFWNVAHIEKYRSDASRTTIPCFRCSVSNGILVVRIELKVLKGTKCLSSYVSSMIRGTAVCCMVQRSYTYVRIIRTYSS